MIKCVIIAYSYYLMVPALTSVVIGHFVLLLLYLKCGTNQRSITFGYTFIFRFVVIISPFFFIAEDDGVRGKESRGLRTDTLGGLFEHVPEI